MYWDKEVIEKDSKDDLYKIITESPCRYCKNFNPQRNFNKSGKYTGITICHAPVMFKDFSCFEPKEEPK